LIGLRLEENSVGFHLRAGCALQDGAWRHHPNGFITLFCNASQGRENYMQKRTRVNQSANNYPILLPSPTLFLWRTVQKLDVIEIIGSEENTLLRDDHA
jgi:hypothetical protein